MTSENNKTESYVKFDGKDVQKFQEWVTVTMAVGAKEGWLEVFIRDVMLDRTSKEEEDVAAVLKNDLAYDYLVMTCTDDALEYMQVAVTADSHGDAHMAWKGLYERYQSIKDNLIALTAEYDNCKLKKPRDNPCQWHAELEYLQLWMECVGVQKKTEAKVVMIIMDRVPAEYEVVMSALRAKPVKEQTLDLVRTVYWEYWDANLKGLEQPSESDRNVSLYTDKKDKNEGDTFFIGMSINKEHEVATASAKAFLKNTEDATGAMLAEVKVKVFRHQTRSQ